MSVIWQPGMRCVCIIDQDPRLALDAAVLTAKKGSVYTVRRVDPSDLADSLLLWFDEISNAHLVGRTVVWHGMLVEVGGEPGFPAKYFRPLSESRIDQFRAMLAPQPRAAVDA